MVSEKKTGLGIGFGYYNNATDVMMY